MAPGTLALDLAQRLIASEAVTEYDVEVIIDQWRLAHSDDEFLVVDDVPAAADVPLSSLEAPAATPTSSPPTQAAATNAVTSASAMPSRHPPFMNALYIVLRTDGARRWALGVWDRSWADLASMLDLPAEGLSSQSAIHLRRLRSADPGAEALRLWAQQRLPPPVIWH